MSANSNRADTEHNWVSESLRNSVDCAATKIVLGEFDQAEWTAMLEVFSGEAKAVGLLDFSRIADNALGELNHGADAARTDYAVTITQLQQALTARVPASPPVGCTRPATSSPVVIPAFLRDDKETLSDFVIESREHLARVETHMMTLEKDPSDTEALALFESDPGLLSRSDPSEL
jgi:sirohydrochlorin ferrochelatase